jgi:hypothetical protein
MDRLINDLIYSLVLKISKLLISYNVFITKLTILPSRQHQNSPKSGKFTPLYLNNHLIINSNNLNLDFYIHFTASIKVTL